LGLLDEQSFDCVIVARQLADMSGLDLLDAAQNDQCMVDLPFILYSEEDLPSAERQRLRDISRNLILREVNSPIRLLDDAALILHRDVVTLDEPRLGQLASLYGSEEALAGDKVLVRDDDLRNLFALTTVLERHQLRVMTANTGRVALRLVGQMPDIDLV